MLKKTVNILIVLNFILVAIPFLLNRTADRSVANLEAPAYLATILYEPTRSDVPNLSGKTISQIADLGGVIQQDSFFLSQLLVDDLNAYLDVISVTSPNFSLLQSGVVTMTEGRTFNEREMETANFHRVPAIVPKLLAEMEGWQLGSTFTLRQENLIDKPLHVEVIGIFESQEQDLFSTDPSTALIIPDIYLHSLSYTLAEILSVGRPEVLEEWMSFRDEAYPENTTFTLGSSVDIDQFTETANEILGPNYNILITPLN